MLIRSNVYVLSYIGQDFFSYKIDKLQLAYSKPSSSHTKCADPLSHRSSRAGTLVL